MPVIPNRSEASCDIGRVIDGILVKILIWIAGIEGLLIISAHCVDINTVIGFKWIAESVPPVIPIGAIAKSNIT